MRNLKRVLSLALASIMLLGMMVVGASAADITAADLKDIADVNNKAAVSLMVDLGIIVGKPDGTFAPTENVDRATMAKLITFIMMGDVDASLFESTKTDLKDIDSSWAKGFINYCYANSIITGDGNGSFFPTKGVTVVEAAKMLLVAIGYDAKTQGYVGSSWSVNIVRDAKLSGLLDGVDAKNSDALTRDNAAKMIFNALFAKTVTYETQYDGGVPYLVNPTTVGNKTLGELQYNLGKVEAIVTGINADGTAVTTTSGNYASLNGIINGKLAASPTLVGGKVVAYYNTNTSKLISTSLTEGASTVLASVNTGISNLTNATTRTHKDFLAELEAAPVGNSQPATVTYFVNGASGDGTNSYGNGSADAAAGGTKANGTANTTSTVANFIKNSGCIVDFVDTNDNGKADVVRITYKSVATLTADPSTKTVTNSDTQVKVPGVINAFSATNTVKTVVGYEDLKKGDVVLFVQIGNMTYIEKAAMVEGVVSAKNSAGELKVDGTYYGNSGIKNASNIWSADFINTYKFYLDNANSIVKAVKVTDESASNYAVVLKSAWVSGTGALGESNYAQAQVLLPDGTTEIVTVAKVGGKTVIADKNSSGAANVPTSSQVLFTGAMTDGSFYTYTKDSKDAYSLTLVGNTVNDATVITNGKAALTDGSNTKAVANANTVFLVTTTGADGKPVYTAYTGIANVPSMTGATIKVAVKGGIASYVYVSAAGTLVGTVGEYVYVPANASGGISYEEVPTADGTAVAYYEIKAIVNGVEETIKTSTAGTIGAADTMYTVTTKDADGVISAVSAASTVTGITVSAGTMIVDTASTKTPYTIDADTSVYYIGTDGTVEERTYDSINNDATDKVIVIADRGDSGRADTVYIMQQVSNLCALSTVKYTVKGVAASDWSTSFTTGSTNTKASAGTAGDAVVVTGATVSTGATYVVSGSTTVGGSTITITVTAEDGVASSVYTLSFTA